MCIEQTDIESLARPELSINRVDGLVTLFTRSSTAKRVMRITINEMSRVRAS